MAALGHLGSAGSKGVLGSPLPDEVVRQRLIDRLADRWNRRLTLVEGPGGFGKSTALAQAVRDNAADPSGVDVVTRVTAMHRSVGQVLAEIAQRLAAPEAELALANTAEITAQDALAGVVHGVVSRSPNDVTIWIDDAHRLVGAPDEVMLASLLDVLPANGHLAVVGRGAPKLPVARLAAGDEVTIIGLDELRFDPQELAQLADVHGRSAADLEHTEGWPAMSRLALVAHERARDYVFDEVVTGLSDEQRTAVAVARIASGADASLLATCGVSLPPEQLARSIPLLSFDGDVVIAHDFWTDFDVALVDDQRHAALVATVVETLTERRRFLDAVDVAVAHEAWDDARSVIIGTLYSGDGLVGASLARRWLDAFPDHLRGEPELQLLDGLVQRLEGGVRDGAELVQAAALVFDERADDRGVVSCLQELGIRSWVAADGGILRPAMHLVPKLLERGDPHVTELVQGKLAADADLRGDYRAAIEALEQCPPAEVYVRQNATMHFFCGDHRRSIELVDELVERAPSPFNRRIRAMHRFMAGEPGLVVDGDCPGLEVVDNSREQALHHLWESVVASAYGRRPPLEGLERVPKHRVREEMFLAVVRALDAIVTHDEERAREVIDQAIDRYGADDPMVRGELLRLLPVVYVTSSVARAEVDDMAPTGWNDDRRAMCSVLLRGREDGAISLQDLPRSTALLSVFPLPWSIEMIALAATEQELETVGARLDELTAIIGRAVHDELRRLADADGPGSPGARRLLAAVPIAPEDPVELRLLGDATVVRCGETTSITARRSLSLLALLSLAESLDRSAVAALLWPDVEAGKALTSLRVAVKQTRDLLEPDRARGTAPFHLRDRLGALILADTEWLRIDVREIGMLLRRAVAIDAGTEPGDADADRRRAFELIRRGWSPVLDDVEEVADELRSLAVQSVAAMCFAAERSLAGDDPVAALDAASAVIDYDPFVERAHAAAIAAHLATGDVDQARAAIDRCRSMLDELGVDAQPGTQMLIRRYERRTGDQVADERRIG